MEEEQNEDTKDSIIARDDSFNSVSKRVGWER